MQFRDAGAARAGGYTLAVAGLPVAIGLLFHPVPAGGFAEQPSILANTPWWGPIHILIAAGFVLSVLGALLVLVGGGAVTHPWQTAWCWGAMAVGMTFFSGVALINGWVMHFLTAQGAATSDALLYDAFNRLLIGYGWLGNPLFLAGLTGLSILEVKYRTTGMARTLAWAGLVVSVLSWGRGIGSATGMYFLEPLIFANVPAFLWLGYYGLRVAAAAQVADA